MKMPDHSAETRLATYGTLAPGRANYHQVEELAGTWSVGTVRGRLVEAGWGAAMGYPGLILEEPGGEIEVHVLESHDLPDHWARLDAFEGSGYERVSATVICEGREVMASIYVIAGQRRGNGVE